MSDERQEVLHLGDLLRLTDQASLAVLRVDERMTVLLANHTAHGVLRRRGARLNGRSVMETFVDHRLEELVRAAASGESGSREATVGERQFVVRACRAEGGGAWVTLEDVTALRRLQRIRTEFIDNLSHELRTPLTTVRLLTEMLSDELSAVALPARARERIATIDVETGHLVQMVNELLDLSRIEQATTRLHMEAVAVGPLVEGALARLRTFAERQSVALRSEVPGDLPPVRGDEERLGQLLVNLLHNAVKFSPEGRTVVVRANAEPERVVVSVVDEGIGISRADQARIFERFYKVDRARQRSAGGTGLGLAIARHIAEAHGGRLWVESEEGRGSTFSLGLPLA
jgi:two-component system, OmpR family, phosphate regulon sensor histidine kinase PhoR